jgi:hypothetical protein
VEGLGGVMGESVFLVKDTSRASESVCAAVVAMCGSWEHLCVRVVPCERPAVLLRR